MTSFLSLFQAKKPVITVLHGRGGDDYSVLENAKREVDIFLKNKIDSFLVENYFCTCEQAEMVLDYVSSLKLEEPIGINILDDARLNFILARKYNCDYMQIDSVSGHLTPEEEPKFQGFISEQRCITRAKIIGGVRFKYQPYKSGRPLEEDMRIAVDRCDAIAVTGNKTGEETDLDKIRKFRALLGKFPLIIAAGLNPDNLRESLAIGDACIVGSYFKENHDVAKPVCEQYVREFMEQMQIVRNEGND